MGETACPCVGAADGFSYEWANRCSDPERKVEAIIRGIAPWKGKTVLDIGAGSGFHSVWFAKEAEHVIAVEPDARMRRQIHARLSQAPDGKISVLAAGADRMPLCDAAADMAYARFAYFFGTPACLPGLAEVARVLKPDGHLFIVDLIPDCGDCGRIARKAFPKTFRPNYHEDHAEFYRSVGFEAHRVDTVFRAPNREALEAVFRADCPQACDELLREVQSLELSLGMAVFHLAMAGRHSR